jgi:hypothetical protein
MDVGVAGVGEEPSSLASSDEFNEHKLFDAHGIPDHTDPDIFSGHSSGLLEDDEHLISVFNHRSFTDNFPFLPPSLFSNCCPPHDITPPSLEDKGHLRGILRSGKGHYNTRSKARAEACVGGTNVVGGANEVGSNRTYCISPSTFLETGSPPPALGGVSLLSPPPSGGVVQSPPGGLLANRLFQPVFPDEPEIVFHEIQLGPLHTMQ